MNTFREIEVVIILLKHSPINSLLHQAPQLIVISSLNLEEKEQIMIVL